MARLLAIVTLTLGASAGQLRAQQPLTEVLSFLLTNQSVPTGDFVRDAEAAQVTSDTMSRLLLVELSTLPLSTSSAGFAYRFNPALGTVERASESFGPIFTERSLTAGRRQASIGASVTTARYTHLDDRDLRDGRLVTTGNQFRDEAQPFDIETLTLQLSSRTVTFLGNLGLTDRIDVGVAVPLVSISLAGERVNTYRDTSLVQATANAQAQGLGDVAVRTKVRLAGERGGGIAAVAEVRLPTGRREDLLGSGQAALRGLLVTSAEVGRMSVHLNGGVSVGGIANEQHYRGALTFGATPRLTLIGEVLGRRIEDLGRVSLARAPHPTISGVDALRLVAAGTSTHTAIAVAGAKWNVARTWVLNGNVTVPLTSGGLRPQATAMVGLDVAFGR